MVFKFTNIGVVRSAEVKLDGLTVIGGENDTGKSTVGKLLFAIVKGISRYEQDLKENKEENLDKMLDDIYLELRRQIPVTNKIREAFLPPKMRSELRHFLDINQFIQPSLFEDSIGSIDEWVKAKIKIVNELGEKFPKEKVIQKITALKEIFFQSEDKNETIKRALKRAFNSEFYSEISPKHQLKTISEIVLSEKENLIFEIRIKNNDIENLHLNDIIFFEDVTFIETPVVLQMYEVIRNADTLLELDSEDKSSRLRSIYRPKVSLHLKDLMAKIGSTRFQTTDPTASELHDSDFFKSISGIMGGSFSFDKEQRDFIFNRSQNGNPKNFQVRSVNTASGIKSFGLIQLLIQANFIDRRSLLIIDEPETHLHPKWQVEYARLLVEMVKSEIPVLLTSHSPYLIQALKVFSEKEKIDNRTHFYLAEKDGKSHAAVIEDVTLDLNRLFQKLSEPFQNLVWE